MQSDGTRQINFLQKSESHPHWKWNKKGSNYRNQNQKKSNSIFPSNPFNQKKIEAETVVLSPGAAAGIGCGAGFGFGLMGGIGYSGWPWNQLRLVFGFGVGCGVGVGFGYGQGMGYGWSMDSIHSYLNEDDLVQT